MYKKMKLPNVLLVLGKVFESSTWLFPAPPLHTRLKKKGYMHAKPASMYASEKSKLHKKKAPKKGREKETKGKDQSPGKQTAQRGMPHTDKGTTK